MIWYGKGKTAQIQAAAKLAISHRKGTHFLCETEAEQTRLQKAVRQMKRRLREERGQLTDYEMSTGRMLVLMRDFVANLGAENHERIFRPIAVLTPEHEAEELARMEARDQVSDDELIARMQAAPDLGGSTLLKLSDFVLKRSEQ